MNRYTRRLIAVSAAALLGGASLVAMASPKGGEGCGGKDHGARSEKMQQRMAARQTELKTALKLTPQQDAAWAQYQQAMTPPKGMGMNMDHAEMAKLTTPQRLEKMQAMHQEHQTQMNQRLQATKTFYATLSPEQQKVFDQQHERQGHHDKRRGGEKEGHKGHQS
ncbi:MAG: hypothetical protein RL323_2283 [Pseudomonadota bacterium]